MSRSFPNTAPRLARPATAAEQAQARALVANRHVDTRESDYRIALATMVNMSGAFEANRARGDRSLYAERDGDRVDHRRPETGLVQDDGSLASEGCQTLGQEGGLNPPTRANTSAAFEANNKLRTEDSLAGTPQGTISAGRPEGERLPTNSGGDGEGQRPVVARWQTESPERLPTHSHEAQSGVAEAKEAAAWHWECKRKAAR